VGYTYATLKTAIATNTNISETNTNFLAYLPTIIDDAEQFCYRELGLLTTVIRDSSATATANSRNFTLPTASGRFVTVKGINIYTPVSTTTTRNQLTPASVALIDALWPAETAASATTMPVYFAPVTDQDFLFGPPPGAAFKVEVQGTIRPAPLSVSNTTTFLTNYLSDLFFAACMVSATGYMRNWGSQADDPKMALSWKGERDIRLGSARVEEAQRKFASGDWTSEAPTPLAKG
jgi:hypothetical protein